MAPLRTKWLPVHGFRGASKHLAKTCRELYRGRQVMISALSDKDTFYNAFQPFCVLVLYDIPALAGMSLDLSGIGARIAP